MYGKSSEYCLGHSKHPINVVIVTPIYCAFPPIHVKIDTKYEDKKVSHVCHPKWSHVPQQLTRFTLWKMLLNGHDLLRENICACTHECTHTLAKKKKKPRKSRRGDKIIDRGFGKILRGYLRVCLFLDNSDRAIRKNRLCLSCSMPPSREAGSTSAPI